MKVNKSQLISATSLSTGKSYRDCQIIINSFIENLSDGLSSGLEFRITNLGVFKVIKRPPKNKTRDDYSKPVKELIFTPSRGLLSKLNSK